MSKSHRKVAILKDNTGSKHWYHKIIRRKIRHFISANKLKFQDLDFDKAFPVSKEIIDDYNYCDYKYKAEYWCDKQIEELKRWKRK